MKVLWEFDLLALYGNDFLVLSGRVVLFFVPLSLVVFYVEDNVRFSCARKAN